MIVRHASVAPFDFEGLAIRDYTAGLGASASFALIEVPPGAIHGEAWSRRSDKYYYVVDGTIEFLEEGDVRTLAAGDFCLVARGGRFSYRNESTMPATLCLFHVPSFNGASEVFA